MSLRLLKKHCPHPWIIKKMMTWSLIKVYIVISLCSTYRASQKKISNRIRCATFCTIAKLNRSVYPSRKGKHIDLFSDCVKPGTSNSIRKVFLEHSLQKNRTNSLAKECVAKCSLHLWVDRSHLWVTSRTRWGAHSRASTGWCAAWAVLSYLFR